MASKKSNYSDYTYLQKRSQRDLLGAMLSMGLVLFILGLIVTGGWLLTEGSRQVLAGTPIKVFLAPSADSASIAGLQARFQATPFVARQAFVSSEEALSIMRKRTGEDILTLTDGINPLAPSLALWLTSPYLDLDSLQQVMAQFSTYEGVVEVGYPLQTLREARSHVPSITLSAIMITLLVSLIVVYLVFSAIRAVIYAKRLNIRTMQLIGATRNFIRRPFVWRGFIQGTFAGLIACVLLILSLSTLVWLLRDVFTLETDSLIPGFVVILGGIVLLGSLLGIAGSRIAVNRFLDQDLTDLMR